MNCITRLLAIVHKEVRQLRRDRLTFGMIVGVPILQVILFGYAINTDVRHLRAGVADQAQTQSSRLLVQDAQASQVVDVVLTVATAQALEEHLRRGDIAVGIHIPPDFGGRVRHGTRAAAQLLIDGSDPVVLGAARRLAELPVRGHGAAEAGGRAPTFEIRSYYNPERRSAVHIVPALIGVILTMTMVLFTSVAIVRERERGNLEMLITTPVTSAELMVGKILPYILIGLIQVSVILAFGVWLFDVPIVGSLTDVYLAALAFIAANLTIGLLISTRAANQFQAMQMTFFFFLPSILLSGFMFPFDGMPEPVQQFAELLPLTHFVRLIRGIVLRGAGIGELAPELWALLAFTAVTLGLSIRLFRKRLD